jgi:hypothetical protein
LQKNIKCKSLKNRRQREVSLAACRSLDEQR